MHDDTALPGRALKTEVNGFSGGFYQWNHNSHVAVTIFNLVDIGCALARGRINSTRSTCLWHAMHERIPHQLSTQIYGRNWSGDQLCSDPIIRQGHGTDDDWHPLKNYIPFWKIYNVCITTFVIAFKKNFFCFVSGY